MSTKFAGEPVVLGGVTYVMAPLTLRSLKDLASTIAMVTDQVKMTDPLEKLDAVATIVHASLSRNYPEMTQEELLDLLDMVNIPIVIRAIMGISGLVPITETPPAPGGAEAAAPLAGTLSTGTLSPPSDGAGNTLTTT